MLKALDESYIERRLAKELTLSEQNRFKAITEPVKKVAQEVTKIANHS